VHAQGVEPTGGPNEPDLGLAVVLPVTLQEFREASQAFLESGLIVAVDSPEARQQWG